MILLENKGVRVDVKKLNILQRNILYKLHQRCYQSAHDVIFSPKTNSKKIKADETIEPSNRQNLDWPTGR